MITQIKKFLRHTISQNALANAVRTVLQVLLAMGGTYFIVRSLSSQQYGIWVLATTFASFVNWIDLGISTALIRFTASTGTQKDRYFWSSFWFYAVGGGMMVIFLWFLQSSVADYFFKDHQPSSLFIVITLLASWIALMGSTIANYLNGLQRMKRSNLIEMFKSLFFYVLVLSSLPQLGILALPVGFLLSNVLGALGGWFLIPQAQRPALYGWDKAVFLKLTNFGVRSYAIALISQAKLSFLRLLTSWMFTLEYVTYLDLALKIASYLRGFLASLSIPLLPAVSLLQHQHQLDKIRRMHTWALYLLAGLATFSCGAVILLAPWIVLGWLGKPYEPTIDYLRWSALAVWFNILLAPAFAIFQGLARFRPLFITAGLGLLGYLFLPLWGSFWFGPLGVLIGYTVAENLVSVGFLSWLQLRRPRF